MSKIAGDRHPEYLSVGLVAKHCGVSNTTVLRWIKGGQLPAFRLPGGHFRVASRDFDKFITRNGMRTGKSRPSNG